MGLTTASELRCRWPGVPITIYARDLDLRSTTSHLAGGQFEPSGVWREYRKGERKAFLGSILQRSRDHIDALGSRAARYGILARSNYTLDQDQRSMDLYTPRDVIPEADRGLLPFENLRVPGRRYRNWLINPTILLPMLRGELQVAGVSFVERNFESRSDLARLPHEIIINCTGYGARALLGDDALVPQRGHLITLERTDEAQNYLFGGGCENGVIFYAFCRQNDIVIGGTIQTGDDREALLPEDPAVFERILSNGALLFGGHPDQCEP
jgi:D-amino-acid oxidase